MLQNGLRRLNKKMTEVVDYQEYMNKMIRLETRIQVLEDKIKELEKNGNKTR